MDSIAYTPLTQAPGCLKCSRPEKDHPLLYGANCMLALPEESANESRDIPACDVEEPVVHILQGLPALGVPPVAEQCGLSAGWAVSKAPAQHISKDDGIAHHHYNYHLHWHINRMLPSNAVYQAWSAWCAFSQRQALNQGALPATQWNNYPAHTHQQGLGPPHCWSYSGSHTSGSHSSINHQLSQQHFSSRASHITPTIKNHLRWG